MVTKLKTLKDLKKEVGCDLIIEQHTGDEHLDGMSKAGSRIRHEAIKHIKSNEIAIGMTSTAQHSHEFCEQVKKVQTTWIKYFFNITDEELKNG